MEEYDQTTLGKARRFVRQCRDLTEVEAPTALASSVLATIREEDAYFQIDSPLGPVYVAYNGCGVAMVGRYESPAAFEQAFRERVGRPIAPTRQPPAALEAALTHTLQGERHGSLHFDLSTISEFERAVLLKTLEIPRGEVRPYAWVAREIGHPRAVRAVGTALAHNPIPLLIPCHRVVQSDGHLGRYSMGGDEAKRTVLTSEGAALDELEALAQSHVRYTGSDTTHIFCFPTCHHARRTTDHHLVRFRSEADAVAAGYRPCKVCRPA